MNVAVKQLILIVVLLMATAAISGQPTTVDQRATQLFNKATEQYAARQYDAAIANYTEYLKLKPNSSAAYFNRGLAIHSKALASPSETLYRQAEADFSRAIELKPTDAEYWSARGGVHRQLMVIDFRNSMTKAIADLTQAIKLNPKLASAYRERGIVYEQANQTAKALIDLNTAIRLDPNDALAFYTRAKVHGAAQRYAQARSDAETAIRLFPNYEAAKLYRTYVNEQIAKAATAKAAVKPTPAPRPSPSPTRPARTTAAPRVAKPDPAAMAAAVTNTADGYKLADAAVKAKDHPLVVAYTTRTLELLPMKGRHATVNDLDYSLYVELLRMRARAFAALGKNVESDKDYFDSIEASWDETLRLMQASNAEYEKDGRGGTGAIMATVRSSFATIICRSGFETGLEWLELLKEKRPNDTTVRVRAGVSVISSREICSKALIMHANNTRSQAFMPFANKAKLLNEAIGHLTKAIEFTPREPRPYTDRAKIYRELGQSALAAADEAKAREFASVKTN